MALNQASLASAFKDTFASLPSSASNAASSLAANYYTFASAGMFGSSVPGLTTAKRDAMASTLLAAIATPTSGAAATFAAAWATALTTFWVGVPVTGAQAGATVGCPGAASLSPTLTTLFANTANTATSCGQGLAAALYTATMTVTAAVAPPPGTVLPIT